MFSAGKDRIVKYWDADKFQLLLTLEGHHAEVWCLGISNRGDFLVTGSHDRSIRRWDRSEEPFFIAEEEEKRQLEMIESELDNMIESRYQKEEIPEVGAVALAGKKSKETITAADAIIDAIDMADAELKRLAEHEVYLYFWRSQAKDLSSVIKHGHVGDEAVTPLPLMLSLSVFLFVVSIQFMFLYCAILVSCWPQNGY